MDEPTSSQTTGGQATTTGIGSSSTSDTGDETSSSESETSGSEETALLSFERLDAPEGFDCATDLAFLPSGDEVLVIRKDGLIERFRLRGDGLALEASIPVPGSFSEQDCGAVSLALDPGFATNRLFYVGGCVSRTHSAISRFELSDDPRAVSNSAAEIIRLGDDEATRPWHNIGSVGFDADGTMWAVFGDKSRSENSQDLSTPLGSLVRIIPNTEPGEEGYEPAPNNPFVETEGVAPEIYAYGLRSPWKAVVDGEGRYWIGDVGGSAYEEVNLVTEPGQNFGWPDQEGPCRGRCDGVTEPVTYFGHNEISDYVLDDPEANPVSARSVWVGGPYLPPEGLDRYDGNLTGSLLFGDFRVGFVRGLRVDERAQIESDDHLGHLEWVTSSRMGPDGFVYLTTLGQCDRPGDIPPAGVFRALLASE